MTDWIIRPLSEVLPPTNQTNESEVTVATKSFLEQEELSRISDEGDDFHSAYSSLDSESTSILTDTPLPKPYEDEQEVFEEILNFNVQELSLTVPSANPIFREPVWHEGTTTDFPMREETQERDYEEYLFALGFQYYSDKAWFKCLIAFRADWQLEWEQARLIKHVEIFAYFMARMRPIEGVGPLAGLFGFAFISFGGSLISDFELKDRIVPNPLDDIVFAYSEYYEGEAAQVVIHHYHAPYKHKVIIVE
ncbi:uncharacterized protein F4822DRAFT_442046 [Hypoxylon trugodes]|uniref:uncharacterized protein n=1 Tax=Hypoxylon trugodes TaxID=326681 RepID=UPI0021968AD2|nr:uncharacterized protein F4822DRAFT_442046 [Hypoxylon trugodes]KAI1390783.1 hypothetical protein F4822DRAFT_442046 [Hypoxylon trugodes]